MTKRQKDKQHNDQKTKEQKTQWPKDKRTDNTMTKRQKDKQRSSKHYPKNSGWFCGMSTGADLSKITMEISIISKVSSFLFQKTAYCCLTWSGQYFIYFVYFIVVVFCSLFFVFLTKKTIPLTYGSATNIRW